MIYNLVRFLIRPFFKAYFNKIIIEGADNIPDSGPIIFAVNHPNSFFDGIVIALTQKRKLHFLARSDAFKRKFIAKLLNKIGLIPIYRGSENGSNVTKNNEVFKNVFEIFNQGGCVLIFSEGVSRLDRKIDTLKKGTARLALQYNATNKFKNKVAVIPVGVNYFDFDCLRSNLHIEFGERLEFGEMDKIYTSQEAKAINQFNQALFSRLGKLIFTANGSKQLTDLQTALFFVEHTFIPKKGLVTTVNQIVVDESKNQKLLAFNETLKQSKLNISHLSLLKNKSILFSILRIVLFMPLMLLVAPGFMLLEGIILISRKIYKSTRLSLKFSTSIVFAASFFILLFLHIIFLLLSIIFVKPLMMLVFLILPCWFVFNKLYAVVKKDFLFLILKKTEKRVLKDVEKQWTEFL